MTSATRQVIPLNDAVNHWPVHYQKNETNEKPTDHYMEREGTVFAGSHLIVDMWEASELDNLALMEEVMRECVKVSGATLLHIHLHHFTPTGGISGVAVLAESHISVHTWPERGYAAFDIFMCGDAEPKKSIPVMKKAFRAKKIDVLEHMRGIIDSEMGLVDVEMPQAAK